MTFTLTTIESFLNAIRGDESTSFAERTRLLADDAPRLILADWLDENARMVTCETCNGKGRVFPRAAGVRGEWLNFSYCHGSGSISDGNAERAEFIRVQVAFWDDPCKICNAPADRIGWVDHCQGCLVVRRSAELLREWGERWLGNACGDWTNWRKINTNGIDWKWTRGFVSHITCTEADWLRHGREIVRAPVCAVERVTLSDAVIPPSGGNMTYYEVWSRLDNLPSRKAALDTLIRAAIEWAWRKN